MPVAPAPPFQYALRGAAVAGDPTTVQAHEQRDRDLEDFLSQLAQWVGFVPPSGGGGGLGYLTSWLGCSIGQKALTANNTPENINTLQAPYGSSGFHLSAANSRIMCDVAGRYRVSCYLSGQSSGSTPWVGVQLQHFRGATLTRQFEHVESGVAASSPTGFSGPMVEGVLDMLVGDEIQLNGYTYIPTFTIDARSYVMIVPVGGAKGDKGDQGIPGNSAGTTAWAALPLAAGWANFAGGYNAAAWRMVGDEVQVRGLIARSPPTQGTFTIATFAAAQRPTARWLFAPPCSAGMARVDLLADGTFQTTGLVTATGDYGYLSLDAIRWSTAT